MAPAPELLSERLKLTGPVGDLVPTDERLGRLLFEMRANGYNVRNSYIPSPDGKRFLVNMALDTELCAERVARKAAPTCSTWRRRA